MKYRRDCFSQRLRSQRHLYLHVQKFPNPPQKPVDVRKPRAHTWWCEEPCFSTTAVYGRATVGGLTVLSLSSSAEKRDAKTGLLVPMPVAVIPRWTVPLVAALAECSPSNKTFENKKVNCKRSINLALLNLRVPAEILSEIVGAEKREERGSADGCSDTKSIF